MPPAAPESAYVELDGLQVFLPEDAVAQFAEEICAGCGATPETIYRVKPGPYGLFGGTKSDVPPVKTPLCAPCHEHQVRRGKQSHAGSFLGLIGMAPLTIHNLSQRRIPWVPIGMVLLIALTNFVVWRWFRAPVWVIHRRNRSEISYRFRNLEAAQRFATANGWKDEA